MKVPAPKKERISGMPPQTVLKNWLTAVKLFLQHYNQLTNLVKIYRVESQLSVDHSSGIGQCPIQELLRLIDLFESELKILLFDVNKSANQGQPALPGGYQILIAHTHRLQELNQQAQIRLQVAAQSPS